MANAGLTYPGALGYVTELLSGDFATAFGRSSHHQVWSEAMVVAPVLRGLLGLAISDEGRTLRIAPSLPATWPRVEARAIPGGGAGYDFVFDRSLPGRASALVTRRGTAAGAPVRLVLAPAFPLDARIRHVTVNGAGVTPEIARIGDEQRAQITVAAAAARTEVMFTYDPGTDVEATPVDPVPGASNEGLRVLRVRPDTASLQLVVEGRAGRSYVLRVRSPRRVQPADGVTVLPGEGVNQRLEIRFAASGDDYVRREITVPLR
jgi:hypothetical protein